MGRVGQFQAVRMQPEPLQTQQLGHGTVQGPLAMGGVSDDRMREVFHVATQLVPPAGQRLQFDQRAARCGEMAVGLWQFVTRQHAVKGLRLLHFGPTCTGVVVHTSERVVDPAFGRRPAAHHGQVGLAHLVRCVEGLAEAPPGIGCIIGVSTSMKPSFSMKRRMPETICERCLKRSLESSLVRMSRWRLR